MRLPAKMVKAAMAFSAKKDVRDYLCGINVTSNHVEATNGHIAIQMSHGVKRAKKGIYAIKGAIPAKAVTIEFVVTKLICIARLLDCFDTEIGVRQLTVINKKFPKLNEKVINELLKKPICNKSIPRLNACYISVIDKAFDYPFVGCDMEFRGESSAVIVRIHGYPNEVYGNPTIVIMPVRKEGGA